MPPGRLPSLSTDLAATLIVEAMYTTDDLACEKYDVCRRTLIRYRQRLVGDDDPELIEKVAVKKAAFDQAWASEFPLMLKKGIQALIDCLDAVRKDPEKQKDPQIIAAIAGAIKIGADVHYTGKIIDARLADAARSADAIPDEASAESKPDYAN